MGAGKATGQDRDYQQLARDILIRLAEPIALVAYSGDGIDVPVKLGSATRTFDVALRDPDGRIVVAECKRTASPVKLIDLDAFAHRVELLRRDAQVEVSGVFFAKTSYQLGAVQAAPDSSIRIAVCAPEQPLAGFGLLWLKYDPVRERKIKDRLEVLTDTIEMIDEVHVEKFPRDPTPI